MKIFSKTIIATALAITAFGTAPASAAVVTYSDTQVMTQNGQDFTFLFEKLFQSNGTGGTITIKSGISETNPGVYDGFDLESNNGLNEYFDLTFDGISQGTYNCTGQDGHTPIPQANVKDQVDCEFSLTIDLSGEDLDALLADAFITIGVLFSESVQSWLDRDQLIVELEYHAVPLPAALPLFIAGIAGIGAVSRRRRNARQKKLAA